MCDACHHGSREALTLMTSAPRSASTWRTERAGDRKTQVEHGDAVQRADHGGASKRVDTAGRVATIRGASARISSVCAPTSRNRPLHPTGCGSGRRGSRPGAASRTRDARRRAPLLRPPAPGRRGLLGRADRLQRNTGLGAPPAPTGRSGTARRPRPSAGSSRPARRCSRGPAGCAPDRHALGRHRRGTRACRPSALASTNAGLGTHCWTQRPSEHRNIPLVARSS